MSFRGLLLAVVLALILAGGLAPPASAIVTDQPMGPAAWQPDGPVLASAVSGGRVFVGGCISADDCDTNTFPRTGFVAALDASTGELLWIVDAEPGEVRSLAVSSDGAHVIAGGSFNTVEGESHRGLVKLRANDGTVESGWDANARAMVRDIGVVRDVAYFGGAFTRHNDIDQVGLGAVLVSTGEPVAAFDSSVDDDDPLTSNEAVYSLATDGARLFVGGRFNSVNGQPRNHLASVTLATNTLDAWAPPLACGGCNRAWDLVVDGSSVFMANRNAGAVTSWDKSTATRRWRVTANGDAQALALADGVLYAGGHFVEMGDPRQPRQTLAALDPATGAIDPDFRPDFLKSFPGIWALSARSDRLYVGGHFTAAGPRPPQRYPFFAMFASAVPNTPPTAVAAANPSSAAVGEDITFSAAGSTDPETPSDLTYIWEFGDGTTATGASVDHAYEFGGSYTATLTVTDPRGASDSATVDVDISGPPPPQNTAPVAQASADPSAARTNEPITLSAVGSSDAETPADGLSYVWDFGNGGTTADATGATVSHAYQQAGSYTVRVTVTDPQGLSDTATADVVVSAPPPANTAPVAQAAASPSSAGEGAQVTFSAAGSSDAETPADLTYVWDFGDGGTTADATGPTVTHAYPQAGSYTATLTVTDPQGLSDTATADVVVTAAPPPQNTKPVAQATADPATAETGDLVTFSAAGSSDTESPNDLTYVWDFGNGGSTADATGRTVTHAYQQAGSYTATVTVTDPQGLSDTATADVVITSPPPPNTAPVAQATANPATARTGEAITFSAAGSGDAESPNGLTYVWDFGNGGSTADATGRTVTHAYQQAGSYTATVTVTDPQGATDTATADVVITSPGGGGGGGGGGGTPPPPVNTAPDAQAAADRTSVEVGEDITFSAAGSGDAETPNDLTYAWDFGNGGATTDATGRTVTHAYQQAGTYTARVTVTDPQGASDSASVEVVVSTTPPPGDTTAPQARVRFGPHPALTRSDLTFLGTASSDDTTQAADLTYAWRFGGRPGTELGDAVTVRFKKPGMRRVTLTVTDQAGNSDTVTREVRVRAFAHCQAPRVDRRGGWRVREDAGAMGGRFCDSAGRQRGPDVLTFTFDGPALTVVHGVARRGGIARVFIDGERQRALSFAADHRAVRFGQKRTYRGLGDGEHVIRIEMRRGTGFLEGFMHGA